MSPYSNGVLQLHEIDVLAPAEALTAFELSCDVAVFVYDVTNANSFEYCASIYKVLLTCRCPSINRLLISEVLSSHARSVYLHC